MDKKVLIGVIGEKLEIIQEQFDIIKEYDGRIPAIEVDLLMSNIRDLYELFITLQQQNQGSHTAPVDSKPKPEVFVENPEEVKEEQQPEPVIEPVIEKPRETPASFRSSSILGFEPVMEEPLKEEEPEVDPEEIYDDQTEPQEPEASANWSPSEPVPEREPEPEMKQEPTPVPPPEPEPPEMPVYEPRRQEHHSELGDTKPHKATIDLFSDGSHGTLADRFKESHEKSVADRLQENKIVDLRTTIGINDKFLFINELFDGNMRIYDDAVMKLNDCPTVAQADLLLLDLKIVYNWDSENPTVKKFVELARKKF